MTARQADGQAIASEEEAALDEADAEYRAGGKVLRRADRVTIVVDAAAAYVTDALHWADVILPVVRRPREADGSRGVVPHAEDLIIGEDKDTALVVRNAVRRSTPHPSLSSNRHVLWCVQTTSVFRVAIATLRIVSSRTTRLWRRSRGCQGRAPASWHEGAEAVDSAGHDGSGVDECDRGQMNKRFVDITGVGAERLSLDRRAVVEDDALQRGVACAMRRCGGEVNGRDIEGEQRREVLGGDGRGQADLGVPGSEEGERPGDSHCLPHGDGDAEHAGGDAVFRVSVSRSVRRFIGSKTNCMMTVAEEGAWRFEEDNREKSQVPELTNSELTTVPLCVKMTTPSSWMDAQQRT